jgi:putative oxidoreductase
VVGRVTAVDPADLALLVLRLVFGLFLAAHGYNKVFGGGGLSGTAGWFRSIGMRWPDLQARLAAFTELGAGILLAAGFVTPLAAAGVIGVMTVASYVAHRRNFFVFKDGWEYTVSIAVAAWAIAAIGPGDASLDHAIGWDWTAWDGWIGAVLAAVVGLGGALVQLAVCYRPQPATATS